jgi:hypothetical protein
MATELFKQFDETPDVKVHAGKYIAGHFGPFIRETAMGFTTDDTDDTDEEGWVGGCSKERSPNG